MAIVSPVRRVGGANFVILSYLYGYLSVVNIGYSIFPELEMFKFVSSIVIPFCLLSVTAFSESPVVKADRTVEISTLVAQMKYDRVSFSAKPGEILKIVLNNPDDLPHNLIVCKPAKGNKNDKGKEVADAVLALGVDGVLQNWIPEKHPRLVAHTGMVNPKEEGSNTFLVPKKEGPYPYVCTFPGHAQMMNGVMIVTTDVSPVSDLTYKFYHGSWDKLPEWSEIKPKKAGVYPGLSKLQNKENFIEGAGGPTEFAHWLAPA